jgi:hypothetical protein
MKGGGDLPLCVGRYWQAPTADRLPLLGGGFTKPNKLYVIGIFPGSDAPVAVAGPFLNDSQVEAALRSVILQPAIVPVERRAA